LAAGGRQYVQTSQPIKIEGFEKAEKLISLVGGYCILGTESFQENYDTFNRSGCLQSFSNPPCSLYNSYSRHPSLRCVTLS
jgi:hypothetical protein